MNKEKFSALDLFKASCVVWFDDWFCVSVNQKKYEPLIIKQVICDEDFLKKYLQYTNLLPESVQLLFDTYFDSNVSLVQTYLKSPFCHRITLEQCIHVIKQDQLYTFQLISKKMDAATWPKDEAFFQALLEAKPFYLLEALNHGYGFWLKSNRINKLIQCQNPLLLNTLASASISLTLDEMKAVLATEDEAMITSLFERWGANTDLLEELVKADNKDILNKMFEATQLTQAQQIKLIELNSKKYLALYVGKHPLDFEAQIKLVDVQWKDILKLHFNKHGINREVLAYQANLESFKDFINEK